MKNTTLQKLLGIGYGFGIGVILISIGMAFDYWLNPESEVTIKKVWATFQSGSTFFILVVWIRLRQKYEPIVD